MDDVNDSLLIWLVLPPKRKPAAALPSVLIRGAERTGEVIGMTEQEKERLLAYLVNKMIRLDNDVVDRRNAMFRHESYVMYYFELAVALIRQRAFREFSEDILKILHCDDTEI